MNARADQLPHEPPPPEVLAGEYVLGVLDAGQRREAQSRIERDPGFSQLVARWERYLAGMLDEIEPADVPAHLWPRIRTRLGWAPVDGARRGAWHSLGLWRGLAVAAAVVAAIALFLDRRPAPAPQPAPPQVVQQPPTVETEPPKPVTVLAHDDGTPGWLASVDPGDGTVLMVPVPSAPDAQGRVPELWLIPAGQSPRSLGLVSTDHSHTVEVPDTLQRELAQDAVLAITLEPDGGAPEGTPTGPIVAKGAILLSP